MKSFVCVLIFVALVAAEPPRYRQSRFRVPREEIEVSGSEKESNSESESAPYAAAGFKPSKEFNLPAKQELEPPSTSYGIPDDSYGAPLNTYLAPQTEYGVPKGKGAEEKGTEEKEGEDNESESAESLKERPSEEGEKNEKNEKKDKENIQDGPNGNVVSLQGAYYVLLPDSQLQRVQFQTENDLYNMAYTARLQYRNEDRAPVYFYSAVPQYQPNAPLTQYGPTPAAYTYYQW